MNRTLSVITIDDQFALMRKGHLRTYTSDIVKRMVELAITNNCETYNLAVPNQYTFVYNGDNYMVKMHSQRASIIRKNKKRLRDNISQDPTLLVAKGFGAFVVNKVLPSVEYGDIHQILIDPMTWSGLFQLDEVFTPVQTTTIKGFYQTKMKYLKGLPIDDNTTSREGSSCTQLENVDYWSSHEHLDVMKAIRMTFEAMVGVKHES